MQVRSLDREDPLEEGMTTHSSTLVWRIPWTEEPGSYSPWGGKELDMIERLTHTHTHTHGQLEVQNKLCKFSIITMGVTSLYQMLSLKFFEKETYTAENTCL